jgi:hypothetical protein
MDLNTFGDILSLTKKRCNISDITDFDDIVSTAINNSYIELKKKNPLVATAAISSSNKLLALPNDCMDIISINPVLYADEYRLGDSIILQRDDSFNLIYSKFPMLLSNNTDVPALNKKHFYALSTYGCYAYYNYKKKHNEASAYMQEYQMAIRNAEPEDMLQTQIQNVYTSTLNGVDVWQGF